MERDDNPFYHEEEVFQMFIFYNNLPFDYISAGTEMQVISTNMTYIKTWRALHA